MMLKTSQKNSGEELKSELARFCLPATNRDATRKLAWVNSISLMFLLTGVFGARRAFINIHKPPPLELVIPAVVESLPPPPAQIEAQKEIEQVTDSKPDAQQVVVVPDSPAVSFAIPSVGNVVAPATMGQAPSNIEIKREPVARVQMTPTSINSTGTGGERPQPPYPQMARELAQQGTVVLTMTVDANGGITGIEVKQSCGFSILDRSTLEFVKHHWLLPAGEAGRVYEAPIRFILSQ